MFSNGYVGSKLITSAVPKGSQRHQKPRSLTTEVIKVNGLFSSTEYRTCLKLGVVKYITKLVRLTNQQPMIFVRLKKEGASKTRPVSPFPPIQGKPPNVNGRKRSSLVAISSLPVVLEADGVTRASVAVLLYQVLYPYSQSYTELRHRPN